MHFFQTVMGQKFYEHDVPMLVTKLSEIASELKHANNLKERELKIKERELELLETQIRKENN